MLSLFILAYHLGGAWLTSHNRVAIGDRRDSLGGTQSRRRANESHKNYVDCSYFPSPYSSHRYDYCFHTPQTTAYNKIQRIVHRYATTCRCMQWLGTEQRKAMQGTGNAWKIKIHRLASKIITCLWLCKGSVATILSPNAFPTISRIQLHNTNWILGGAPILMSYSWVDRPTCALNQACSSIFTVVVQRLLFAPEDCGSAQALLQEHHSHASGDTCKACWLVILTRCTLGSLFRYMTEKEVYKIQSCANQGCKGSIG